MVGKIGRLIAFRTLRFFLLMVLAAGIYRFGIYELGWSNNLKYPFSKLVATVLLVAVGILVLFPDTKQRMKGNWQYWLWVIAFISFVPFYLLKYLMGVNDIEALIVFFQGTSLKDATNFAAADFIPYIAKEGLTVVVVFVVAYILFRLIRHFGVVLVVLACALIYLHPATRYLADSTFPNPAHALINFEDDVHPVQITSRPENPKNVILLYLESLERTYFDVPEAKEAIEGLIPIAKQGFEAVNISQVRGTESSVPGNVATQCGVPLLPKILNNPMSQKVASTEEILPSITCLSDILREDGYNSSYVVGTDLEPMSLGRFLETHQYKNLLGLGSISQEDKETYKMNWGVTDEHTFARAATEIRRLSKEDAPFLLSVATMATHGPDGFPSENCEFDTQLDSKMLRSMYCTVEHVKGVVGLIEELGLSKNTVIVVMSDHLAPPNIFRKQLAGKARRNLFFILNAGSNRVTDKPALAFDIYPTILEAMGYELKDRKANLGVSLYSDIPGLISRIGDDKVDGAIRGNKPFAAALWE